MRLTPFVAATALLSIGAAAAGAQCPDGSTPPCRTQTVARARPLPIDPSRVVVLPFRVTTADTLLGEGLAELVASELSDESGPRAVHMGSVLRGWRQAGGGLRTPLPQQSSVSLARELGAGLLVEGTVVGLGSRLRMTAELVNTQDGSRRAIAPVSGNADSLETLLRRVTAGLIAATGRGNTGQQAASMTDSPAAMRAYLEGLSLWRRNMALEARVAFERAWELDTMFVSAAFWRYRMANWQQAPGNSVWAQRVRLHRQRLSREERLLATAYLGDEQSAPGQNARMDDRRRIAALLPESPDAQWLLGDHHYHWGFQMQIPTWFEESQRYFDRALALDSLSPIVAHSLEHALISEDTARIRKLWKSVPADEPNRWALGWISAQRLGDKQLMDELRRAAAEQRMRPTMVFAYTIGITPEQADEMFAIAMANATPAQADAARRGYWITAVVQGRPAAAARIATAIDPAPQGDMVLILASIFAGADSAQAVSSAASLAARQMSDSTQIAQRMCVLAHWRLRHGEAVREEEAWLRDRGSNCAEGLALGRSLRDGNGSVPDSILLRADTVLTTPSSQYIVSTNIMSGYDRHYLADAWERRGDYPRALKAIRAKSTFQGFDWIQATDYRREGKLAAAAGDTTGAIFAYRRYLQVRGSPEPKLVPERDSVRAELARLIRK